MWRAIGAREDHAIALCIAIYERADLELNGEAPRELPDELRHAMSRLVRLRQANPN
jgi:hypothetical protein